MTQNNPPKDSNVTQLKPRKNLPVRRRNTVRNRQTSKRLNRTFTHILNDGKNYVVREGLDAQNRPRFEFFTLKEFRDSLLNERKQIVGYNRSGEEKNKNIADLWLESPLSNFCDKGITFVPIDNKFVNGRLNAYFGYGVNPQNCTDNDIQPYLDHIFNIICDKDNISYEYLLNWMSHLVQKPEEKPEVAIILRAGQGAGKGTFVDPLGKIIGAHYSHVTSSSQMMGRFNSFMENKILIFADEFFAGSKKSTDMLKGMITEKTQMIERKGIDQIETPSYSRLIMASNHENIVKIERDERRYLFLDVSDEKKTRSPILH
ncbi:DUF5906 domain-containing protein (plasmid) [Xenorhabdus sp. SF857]|uniref:primase-helicase family protein n=1 Tax=Xenorhabdus bakwenae TaxID=3026967 RepID=UPI002557F162|nr:primase-helicase family protein [Xenorhabdus sp. SF857]WFQ78084.1 DUF5906 domain-containing protein [Xenorhabdus sp. SF857]